MVQGLIDVVLFTISMIEASTKDLRSPGTYNKVTKIVITINLFVNLRVDEAVSALALLGILLMRFIELFYLLFSMGFPTGFGIRRNCNLLCQPPLINVVEIYTELFFHFRMQDLVQLGRLGVYKLIVLRSKPAHMLIHRRFVTLWKLIYTLI